MKPGLINVVFNLPALLKRQLPIDFSGRDAGWRFTYNSNGICDYLVVFDDLPGVCRFEVSSGIKILICTEPSSVRTYGDMFLSQFTHVISTNDSIGNHLTSLTKSFVPIPWHIGWNHSSGDLMSFEELNSSFLKFKQKKLSIVCSSKCTTEGHRKRLNFLDKFLNKTRHKPDVYGLGEPFNDKINGLKEYEFTLVIENTRTPYYWTEKLSDAFIAESFPLYYGDPKASFFFNPKSFFEIDSIDGDINKTVNLIDDFIEITKYIDIRQSLLVSKNMVMNKYEYHNFIISIIDNLINCDEYGYRNLLIFPEKYFIFDKLKFYKRKIWNTKS